MLMWVFGNDLLHSFMSTSGPSQLSLQIPDLHPAVYNSPNTSIFAFVLFSAWNASNSPPGKHLSIH